MASTVVSAAVAARKCTRVGSPPFLVNPFHKQQHSTHNSDEPGGVTYETSSHQPGCSNGRTTRTDFIDYGSITNPRLVRHLDQSHHSSGTKSPGVQADTDYVDTETTRLIGSDSEAELDDPNDGICFTPSPTSSQRIISLYSLVPITAVLTVIFFILLRHFLWPARVEASHLGLVFLGAAIWTVSFALRIPVYQASSLVSHNMPNFTPFVFACFQVFVEELLRLSSLILAHLRIQENLNPEDPAFSFVWSLALGWAIAEVVVSISQGYGQLLLYKDDICSDESILSQNHLPDLRDPQNQHPRDPEAIMNREIDQIIRIRTRIELEALYGIPVPDIPVFVSCLLRVDSITLSFALFLIISSSYLSSAYLSSPTGDRLSDAIRDTIPTFLVIFMLRTFLSFAWTLNILPRIGLHTASYMSCVCALGALFVGLGRWDAV